MKKIPKDIGILRLCTTLIFVLFSIPIFSNTDKGHTYHGPPIQDRQQKYLLTGTVKDGYGPLPGVHVLIKGTDTGTFTDKDGNFSLTVQASNTLVFSYMGYKTLEMSVLGKTTLEVELLPEATQLQEVEVNAGYYTVKERERTGSISRVTAEEIELQPIVSPLEALQGRMAGVEVVQRSGVPGSAPVIRIRGQNSLRSEGNYPLYIIDGVPINSTPLFDSNIYVDNGVDPLNTLNLSNIVSLEVLKDADATAIYGSRGANGVVLITTKKGVGYNKRAEIEVRLYSGFGKVSNKMDLLNTKQYLSLRREALGNDGKELTIVDDYDLLVWDQNRYTDWQQELVGGTASIKDVNISATGGNATTSFRLGGSYHKEGTVFSMDNNYNKITVGLNLNHISENKKLGIDLSVNYGKSKSNSLIVYNILYDMVGLPPNAPSIYNNDGSLNWEDWKYSKWPNPLADKNNTATELGDNILANLGLSYELLSGLSFKTNIGYTNQIREIKRRTLNEVNAFTVESQHSGFQGYNKRQSWIIEPQLVYQDSIGEGTINGLVGLTFQENESGGLSAIGQGYVSKSLVGYLPAAESIIIGDNRYVNYKYNAIYARFGYNLKRKYFINLTGRRDGSSRFGPNKRFANFGAIGGAWIFTEEPIVKQNFPFLSFGKLRASYGTTGSDQIGDYGYMDAYEATSGPGGVYPTQLTNPNFSWEINKKLEVAIELGFIKDRVTLGISRYRNHSSNQLVGSPLPAITGFTTIQANLPAKVQNTGWEIELSSLNIQSKDFRWQTFFNISLPNNKLISFPNIEQTAYAHTYRVGHPLNIQLLYRYDGIDPITNLYRVVDVNKDGSYNYDDRLVIKNRGREYYGGLANNISYKGFDLRFLWEFVNQEAKTQGFAVPGSLHNQPVQVYKSWQNAEIQKISQSSSANTAYSRTRESDYFFSDASYLRLKTLSLSYELPSTPIRQIGLRSCKFFLLAQNLLTITNYSGFNIEAPGSTSLPTLRIIGFGAQLNF